MGEQINKYNKIECAGCIYDGKTKCILRENKRNDKCRTVIGDTKTFSKVGNLQVNNYRLEIVPRNIIPDESEPLPEYCEEYI